MGVKKGNSSPSSERESATFPWGPSPGTDSAFPSILFLISSPEKTDSRIRIPAGFPGPDGLIGDK